MRMTREFEVELSTGLVCKVEVEAFGEYEMYGQDADGNRGEMRFSVTDEEVIGVYGPEKLELDELIEAKKLALEASDKHDWRDEFDESGEPEDTEER